MRSESASVSAKRAYYERGVGFPLAVAEARRLLAAGVPDREILEAVGFPPTNRRALAEARRQLADQDRDGQDASHAA